MFSDIYSGKRIFITGHTGFKGSWLSAWLLGLGAKVTGFSIGLPSTPANFEALGLSGRVRDLRGDVRNLGQLKDALVEAKPEAVFHLAAQALVRNSYDDPVGTVETNVLGVMNILEAARKISSVKAIVVITSDKCYRNDEWVWGYRETDRLGGADPYSASKGCAELIAHSWFDSFYKTGAACATARAGNVVGGGDWAQDRIVPDCARAWAMGEKVMIRNPGATRPWQHVLEPLSGYLVLGQKLLEKYRTSASFYDPRGQSYNFGPPADINASVEEVVKTLKRFWPNFRSDMNKDSADSKRESRLLKLCCDKALAELDWKATLNFEETMRYTAEWYARYYAENADRDMWNFTQGQIAAYANLALERGLQWARDGEKRI